MKCVSSAWRGDSVWKPSSRSGSTVRIVKHREGAPDSQPRGPVTPGLAAHPAALPTVPVPLKRDAQTPRALALGRTALLTLLVHWPCTEAGGRFRILQVQEPHPRGQEPLGIWSQAEIDLNPDSIPIGFMTFLLNSATVGRHGRLLRE